jgi:hypothetical protein
MNKPPSGTQVRLLIACVKRLTQSVDRCAASIRLLSAAVMPFAAEIEEPDDEPETETPQSNSRSKSTLDDQPIVLTDKDGVTISVETVHGIRDNIRIPRRRKP